MSKYNSALEEKLAQAEDRKRAGKPMLMKDVQGRLVNVQPRSGLEAAQALGQQAPTTPLGVAEMGASPDVAKMAGTPTQVEGALRQETEEPTISQARRQQQARAQATAQEQEVLEKSQHLQNLGSLGDQVHKLISGEFNKLQGETIQVEQDIEALPSTLGEALALPEGPQREQAIQQSIADWANQKVAAGEPVVFAELTAMFPNAQEAIASMAQAGLEDTVQVDDTLLANLGYSSKEEFLDNTGIEIPEGTTLQQFQALIQQSVDQEFAETERLQSIMNDPSASAVDRAAARQQLIDIGAVGLRGAEAQAHALEQQVAEADEIEILGERVSVEQALSDDYISSLIKRAIDNPEFLEKLQEENPGLASFISTNQELLASVTEDVEESTEALEQVKEQQREAVRIENLGDFSDETLRALGIDLDQYQTSVQQLPDTGYIKLLRDEGLPPEQRQLLLTSINEISKYNPEFLESLGGLSDQEIESLGGVEEGSILQVYANYLKNPDRAPADIEWAMRHVDSAEDLFNAEERIAAHDLGEALGRGVSPRLGTKSKQFYEQYKDILEDGEVTKEELGTLSLEEKIEFADRAGRQSSLKDLLVKEFASSSEEALNQEEIEIPANFRLPSILEKRTDRQTRASSRGAAAVVTPEQAKRDVRENVDDLKEIEATLADQLNRARAVQDTFGGETYSSSKVNQAVSTLAERLAAVQDSLDKHANLLEKQEKPKTATTAQTIIPGSPKYWQQRGRRN